MASIVRHPKNFWIGIIFLFFGLAAVYHAWELDMGTAGRMGPAYFPTALGSLLALVGLLGVVRSFIGHAESIGKVHIKDIMEKLGAKDRTEAVSIALRRGMIQL